MEMINDVYKGAINMVIKDLMRQKDFRTKMLFWFGLWGSVPMLASSIESAIKEERRPSVFMRLIGLKLMFLGVLLNAIGGKTLKKYGHFDVSEGISAPDRVVDKGIYSCMRHPAQFGSGLMGLGIGMLTGKLAGLISGMLAFMMSLIFMLNVEEPETMKRFPDYCEKMAGKPAFTLRPSCLLKGIIALFGKNH
jgi:protein-S-isoprenylcysteine O-methyltransferase Ste14